MVESVERDSRGILHPGGGLAAFRLDRFVPSGQLARFVDRYWLVSWDLPPGQHHEQQVLIHPTVNITFDRGVATASGVLTKRFSRVLEGSGRALGIMFRPGGFYPFLGEPLSTITDKVMPLSSVAALSGLEQPVSALLVAGADGEHLATALDALLKPLVPTESQASERTTGWAERIAADRSLTRVEDQAALAGVNIRKVQRAFADHIGIGPKWVIRRYRIYDAAEQIARRENVDLAALTADLGYADQSHLTRDFTAMIGHPPAQYAATSVSLRPGLAPPADIDRRG